MSEAGMYRNTTSSWQSIHRRRAAAALALALAVAAIAATPVSAAPAPKADLSLTMADAPDPVVVGGDLTYTITIRSAGPATNVSATDTLPTTATFRSVSTSQGSCANSGGVVTCNLGSLASNQSATVQVVVRPGSAGTISNTAKVTASEKDSSPSNNSATASTTVNAPGADLSVTNTASSQRATTGQQLSYTNVVTNAGPLDATDVTVTNTFSGSSATVSQLGGSGGSCFVGPQPRTATCSFASIPPGESRTMTVMVKLEGTGTLTSTATATGSSPDPNSADNAATAVTVVTEGADLGTTVHEGHADPYVWADDLIDGAEAGLTYVVRVRNNSANVTATDVLVSFGAGGLRDLTFQPSQGVCSEWGECVVDDIAPTGTVTVLVSARACQSGDLLSYLLAGALSFGTGDPVSANDNDTETTTVVGAPLC